MIRYLHSVAIFIVLFLTTALSLFGQETEASLKETADKLFNNEQYVAATSNYLTLISLNPRSFEYNFKYGTCLLFNSYKKQDAFKFLNYAVTDPEIDVRAYFFLGKAYHLNYQFNEAIKQYENYKIKAGSKVNPAFDVNRQIEMCQNGKRLLSTITDLVVMEKKEIERQNFFRLYDLKNIGGDIIVAADFQSKIDKKKNFTPLIHFPSNATFVYYASYGDIDTGQKDIYVRSKLPDGSWSLPQKVEGKVNSNYDEDFPYLSPNGLYLYFSSKGHNAMGGYDVFRSRYNPEDRSFGVPENMDFAVSSPDDDLFFVVDSLDENAYFASSRQSSNGKLFVYKVKVARVPLQLAVIKGQFASTVQPDNKKIAITVTDFASNEKIGTFSTNEQGNYLITLPKGGKYIYEMKVNGSETLHKYVVTVPFLKEFKPLKQAISEEIVGEEQVVKVTDMFDETVEDPQAVLAEIVKLRSELNVNVQQYNLDALAAEKENQKILSELGLENAGPQEIVSKFEDITEAQEAKVAAIENLNQGSLNNAMENLNRAEVLQNEAKEIVAASNNEADDEAKLRLLKEAQAKMIQANELKAEVTVYTSFADSISKVIPAEKQVLTVLTEMVGSVKNAVENNDYAALKKAVTPHAELLRSVEKDADATAIDPFIEAKELRVKEAQKLEAQLASYSNSSEQLTKEIQALAADLANAKSKDQPSIQQNLDRKKEERDMVNSEVVQLEKKIQQNKLNQRSLDSKIEFLTNVTAVDQTQHTTAAEVQSKATSIDTKNYKTLAAFIDQQVTELAAKSRIEQDTNSTVSSSPEMAKMESIRERIVENDANQKSIESASELTEKDKLNAEKSNASELLTTISETLDGVNGALSKTPTSKELLSIREELVGLKKEYGDRVAALDQELASLNSAIVEPVKDSNSVSVQPVLATTDQKTVQEETVRLMPNYESRKSAAAGSSSSALEEQLALEEQFIDIAKDALNDVTTAIKENPTDEALNNQLSRLNSIIEEHEITLLTIQSKLVAAKKREQQEVLTQSLTATRDELVPGYTERMKEIATDAAPGTLMTAQDLDEELVNAATSALSATQDSSKQNLFETIIRETNNQINERKLLLNAENTASNNISKNAIRPKYEENISKIEQSATLSADEKHLAKLNEENAVLEALTDESAAIEKALLKAPNDSVLKVKLDQLNEFQAVQEELVNEQKLDLIAREKGHIKPDVLRAEIYPEYMEPAFGEQARWDEKKVESLLKEEAALRSKLEKVARMNEKKSGSSFDPELAAENEVISELYQSSNERSAALKAGNTMEQLPEDQLKLALGAESPKLFEHTYSSLSEAQRALNRLQLIEDSLDTSMDNLNQDDASQRKQGKIIEAQLAFVRNQSANIETQLVALQQEDKTNEQPVIAEVDTTSVQPADEHPIDQQIAGNVRALTVQKSIPMANATVDYVATIQKTDTSLVAKENTLSLLQTVQEVMRMNEAQKNNVVVLTTSPHLSALKSSLTMAIGQINAQLSMVEQDSDKQALITEKQALQAAIVSITQLESRLQLEKAISNSMSEGLTETVSREEELEMTANIQYPAVLEKVKELHTLEKQLTALLEALNRRRGIIDATTDPEQRIQQIDSLNQLSKEYEAQKLIYLKKNEALDQSITQLGGTPLKWKNVLEREVMPTKNTVIADIVAPLVGNGFEVQNTTVVRLQKTIPFGIKPLSGLVYRVQVGAFAKPIPEALFKEFTPVTGEKLDNGITRYLAGYFNSRNTVVTAQKQIQALGYTDAFVVAYCDGNRISLAEARRLEDLGLCVPKNQDSMVIEVVTNTIAQLPKDSIEKYTPTVQPSDYNKAPGAAVAKAVEETKGLFYTVQVGVYNMPVSAEQVKNISPLITKRLDNGQIRYSSGIFISLDDARLKRKEAISRGILDAFITAYYNGERISIDEARKIIAEKGESVLATEAVTSVQEPIEHVPSIKDPVQPSLKREAQLVSKSEYSSFPRTEMERLNTYGSFYYDTTDLKIKSTVYSNVGSIPSLMGWEFDTLMNPVMPLTANSYQLTIDLPTDGISGQFANWLLRSSIRYRVVEKASNRSMVFYLNDHESALKLESLLNSMGIEQILMIGVEEAGE